MSFWTARRVALRAASNLRVKARQAVQVVVFIDIIGHLAAIVRQNGRDLAASRVVGVTDGLGLRIRELCTSVTLIQRPSSPSCNADEFLDTTRCANDLHG